jgi:hypothetical protein
MIGRGCIISGRREKMLRKNNLRVVSKDRKVHVKLCYDREKEVARNEKD